MFRCIDPAPVCRIIPARSSPPGDTGTRDPESNAVAGRSGDSDMTKAKAFARVILVSVLFLVAGNLVRRAVIALWVAAHRQPQADLHVRVTLGLTAAAVVELLMLVLLAWYLRSSGRGLGLWESPAGHQAAPGSPRWSSQSCWSCCICPVPCGATLSGMTGALSAFTTPLSRVWWRVLSKKWSSVATS